MRRKKWEKVLAICLLLLVASASYANAGELKENAQIESKLNTIIKNVDREQLEENALRGYIDTSVPENIRNNIVAEASFTPMNDFNEDVVIDIKSAVEKIGEVNISGTENYDIYAATSVAYEVKEDSWTERKDGAKVTAIVYWIDGPRDNNELYAVEGIWFDNGKVCTNKTMQYGTSDVLGLHFTQGPTTLSFDDDKTDFYIRNSYYRGLTLCCKVSMEIVNVGTLKVTSTSQVLT